MLRAGNPYSANLTDAQADKIIKEREDLSRFDRNIVEGTISTQAIALPKTSSFHFARTMSRKKNILHRK